MSTNWDSDEQLIADLGAALREQRAVPARFLEIGRAAFAWRDVDAELAAMTYDSAAEGAAELVGTRAEPATVRAMTFAASSVTIELEVTADALVGQVVPARPGSIEVRLPDGSVRPVPVDEVGWFVIRPRPAGLFRLHLHTADGDVLTEWTTL